MERDVTRYYEVIIVLEVTRCRVYIYSMVCQVSGMSTWQVGGMST